MPRRLSVEALCSRTFFVFKFMRMSTFMFSVTGVYSSIQAPLSGDIRGALRVHS